MFAFWWVGAKFVPGGTALSAAMVNCFVHVLMYTYYALSTLKIERLLKWKRYLTLLQLVQFSTGVLLGIRAIVTNCQFTRWMQYFFVCYAFSFILLFGQFYHRTYRISSTKPKSSSKVKSEISLKLVEGKTSSKSSLSSPTNEAKGKSKSESKKKKHDLKAKYGSNKSSQKSKSKKVRFPSDQSI